MPGRLAKERAHATEVERVDELYARGIDAGEAPHPSAPVETPDIDRHLRRVTEVREKLRSHMGAQAAARAAFDTFTPPTFICNPSGRILHRNAAARAMSPAGASLLVDVFGSGPHTARTSLAKLVSGATSGSAGGVVQIRSGGHNFTVIVRPLGDARSACLVAAFDESASLGPAAAILQRSFQLTRAELRLAEGLIGGGTLPEIAERLGIGHETARTQLRSLFAKTGTDRQVKLLRLFLQVQLAARPTPDIA